MKYVVKKKKESSLHNWTWPWKNWRIENWEAKIVVWYKIYTWEGMSSFQYQYQVRWILWNLYESNTSFRNMAADRVEASNYLCDDLIFTLVWSINNFW